MEDDSLVICKYEVGTIINNNRDTIHVGNDLESANNFYEATVNKYWDKSFIFRKIRGYPFDSRKK